MPKESSRTGRFACLVLLSQVGVALAGSCPFQEIEWARELAGKRLTILGSDHETDVFDATVACLRASNPDAISVEQFVRPYNLGDMVTPHKLKEGKDALLSGAAPYTVKRRGKYVKVMSGDLVIFDGRKRGSEANGAIAYAHENGKPFYFTDWSTEFPDVMFRFENGRITPVNLRGKTTYQEYPQELSSGGIYTDNVRARNRFTADGMRVLYGRHQSIGHVGGMYHFTPRYVGEDARLQDLVPTGKQEVHFLVSPDF